MGYVRPLPGRHSAKSRPPATPYARDPRQGRAQYGSKRADFPASTALQDERLARRSPEGRPLGRGP